MDNNNIYSITAHVDLLGFSSHLVLSSYDLRTKIGKEAIERLKILDKVIELVEAENKSDSGYYPESFRILRFNDSIILGIDINHPIIPQIGKPNEEVSYTISELRKFFSKKNTRSQLSDALMLHFNREASKIAQFVGIIARIHNYINLKEFDMHMPGCRTVISSGLRYKFINHKNEEDFYSANFSLSNAYIANDLGSKAGFIGNKCFIEDNVARIAGYNLSIKRFLGYMRFIPTDIKKDPFEGCESDLVSHRQYKNAGIVSVELFGKKYNFREINTNIASNSQIIPAIIPLLEKQNPNSNRLLSGLLEMLKSDTPSVEDINNDKAMQKNSNSPVSLMLYISIGLDISIKSSFDSLTSL